MSQDRPDEPEPTRIAGSEPPKPAGDSGPSLGKDQGAGQQGWSPAGAQPPGRQPGQQPGQPGQQPDQGGWGQPGGQPAGQGGQPGWGQQQPGQPGQPGWGQQGGQPGYGQPGYGQPGGGYGGPGGPGGPGGYGAPPGYGPGGPGGPGGPRKPKDKKPLIIAGAVLAVLLIVGGIGLAFVLGGDDEDTEADPGGGTSESTEAAPSEESSPSEEESAEEAPSDVPSFTAADYFEMAAMCEPRAMSNASEYDAADPRIKVFAQLPEAGAYQDLIGPGIGETWGVEIDRYEDVSVAMCLVGEETGDNQTCDATDLDDNEVTYEFRGVNYSVVYYEALTGAELGTGNDIEAGGACPDPEYTTVTEDGETRYASPDTEDVNLEVNTFITEGGGSGSDS